jgi:hypothetical protein
MLSLHKGQCLHTCWPHQVTRYQKWVLRRRVDASPVKVDQLDFLILRNHDIWSLKVPEDVALTMQNIQSMSDFTHKSWWNPLHLIQCLTVDVLHHNHSKMPI